MATADVIVGMVALLSGIVGSTGLWRVHRFFRALQEDHPEMWVTLGRPTLLGSFGDQDAIRRFLRRRQYRALGDPVLSTLGDQMRWYERCSGALLVVNLAVLGFLLVVA